MAKIVSKIKNAEKKIVSGVKSAASAVKSAVKTKTASADTQAPSPFGRGAFVIGGDGGMSFDNKGNVWNTETKEKLEPDGNGMYMKFNDGPWKPGMRLNPALNIDGIRSSFVSKAPSKKSTVAFNQSKFDSTKDKVFNGKKSKTVAFNQSKFDKASKKVFKA